MGDCSNLGASVNDEIALKLTRQEAIVFFEWLAVFDTLGAKAVRHRSEEKVFWKLHGQLESTLSEPFAANYSEILAEARRLVDSG